VAVRKTAKKTNKKNTSHGPQAIVIFWLIFIIVIISIFMLNAQTIQRNFNIFKTRLTAPSAVEEPLITEESPAEPVVQQTPAPVRQPSREPAREPVVTVQEPVSEPARPQTQTPARETPVRETPAPERPAVQTPPPVQTRDRNIYFTQIDKDGQILHSRVTRRIPVSESPMLDALNVLLTGPSADELNRGLLNLIPQNTRILSATVRGNTAYISFSEDFLFNTFGVEGYVAQLRQIVWTVTEFQNVRDVQILIEGRRMDYLGEGIWIGSPINRQSF
jgi:spore germination protein GerM